MRTADDAVVVKEFAINAAQSSLVLSVSTAMLAFGLLVTGPISDRIGRKPVMVFALACAALSTLASAVMPSWELVLATARWSACRRAAWQQWP